MLQARLHLCQIAFVSAGLLNHDVNMGNVYHGIINCNASADWNPGKFRRYEIVSFDNIETREYAM